MKKLIIIATVVLAAFTLKAASYNWSTKTGQNVYLPGTTGSAVMTAYLFNSDAVSQQSVLSAFDAGTFGSLSSLTSLQTTSAGKIATTATGSAFTYGSVGDTLNAFYAIVTSIDDKDYVYISEIASAVGPETGTAKLQYSSKDSSQALATEFAPGAASFGGAGWYTAAVPEPTSGLLLLLGMAGLALKRKRA